MKLNIVRLEKDPEFSMPSVSRTGDAGIDLIATSGGMISPGSSALVGCGFSIEIPEGYVGLVCPRSGLSAKYHISVGNAPGVIDSSYRGEVKIILEHRGHSNTNTFQYWRGDRIAQLVIVPFVAVSELVEVDTLSDTDRGAGGFGSTGVSSSKVAIVAVTNESDEKVDEPTLALIEEFNAPPAKLKGKKASK